MCVEEGQDAGRMPEAYEGDRERRLPKKCRPIDLF